MTESRVPLAAAVIEEPLDHAATTNRAAVLIAEDEAIVALELQQRLLEMGHEVADVVDSGEQAVLKTEELHPDLVLMDIRLQGSIDGISAAERIRRQTDVPVVFLTAHSDRQTVARAKLTEPFGYLLKPFEEKALRTTIETALYRYRVESERRQVQRALERSELRERLLKERLEFLLGSIPAVTYVAQPDEEFRWSFVSDKLEGLLGYSPSDPIEDPGFFSRHIHPDHVTQVRDAARALPTSGREILQFRFRHRDGNYRWIRDEMSLVRPAAGRPPEIVGFWVDVTENKRTEEELLRSQRLAATGTLIAGLAHEVLNPLFAISAVVDTLEAEPSTAVTKARFSGLLRQEIERLRELMDELLNYAEPLRGKPGEGSLVDAVEDAVRVQAQAAARAQVTITTRLRLGDETIHVRSRLVSQVFQSLLDNAVGFSPTHGQIEVAATLIVEDSRRFIECHVRDHGAGFNLQDLPRVFEPFFTVRQGSRGLGLAVAQRVVEELGGWIKAENAPTGGALVTFRVPCAA